MPPPFLEKCTRTKRRLIQRYLTLSRMQAVSSKENRRSLYLNQRYASEAVMALTKKQGDTELDDDDDVDDPFILVENRDLYEVGDESTSSGTTTRHSSSGAESYLGNNMDLRDIEAMAFRTKILVVLVLCLGIVASTLFMTFGILNSKESDQESFETRANELTYVVQTTWSEYERVAAQCNEICRREPATTRSGFREFYEYLVAGGIDFQAIQCAPNVTNEERADYEAEAKAYWEAELEDYNYTGFTGLVWDWESMSVTGVEKPAPVAPFYFPIHFLEPVQGNEGAIDLNLWSDPVAGAALIQEAITTFRPILTGRLKTVQETEENAYSVIIYHPGIPLSTDPPGKVSRMIANLLVRIPSLLERVGKLQDENLAVYVYDIREDEKQFLGGAIYTVNTKNATSISFPAEIDYASLKSQYDQQFFHEESIQIASGYWQVCVVPIDDTFYSQTALVIFGGVMIFLVSVGIALWMDTNMKRIVGIYKAKVQAEAERAIVENLFPENVRKRLLQGAEAKNAAIKERARNKRLGIAPETSSYNALTSEGLFGSKPIADFHPEATLLFADLVGFTAWSSVREPSQVFTLLEVLYNSFDRIAQRRRVFKVETVGDCYVASCGAPIPRSDHAVVMARYASDCLRTLPLVVTQLERTLGPDTGDLMIRIGLHSGAVTSGVLRGDKGRFQLFGDTMNTASRMESTGLPMKIQVSPDTAELLEKAGKSGWLEPREVKVFVKGKGHLQTYWLVKDAAERARSVSNASSGGAEISTELIKKNEVGDRYHAKIDRLVGWNVERMCELLKEILSRRLAKSDGNKKISLTVSESSLRDINAQGTIPLDEVQDVVVLPEFDARAFQKQIPVNSIQLDTAVLNQLTDLVTMIGEHYRDNPFHNFEHASHVAMSVSKLLSRIISPREQGLIGNMGKIDIQSIPQQQSTTLASELHDHTFGITSDPLTAFAAFFAALIHDLDHNGVPNTVLKTEQPDLSKKYRETSIAEQNSIDLAWEMFMRREYKTLRRCICPTDEELGRFRQLVVQMVMSTDIMDQQIGKLRKERWNKAFSDVTECDVVQDRNRKATIVIEHLIQASDVSHTMQHWHIYRKWNQNLFFELYHAYKQGRLEKDPSPDWYKGELSFFDFYVIPLAKKLDTCGVFGVTSDEFLMYAMANRKEWEMKGEQLVQDYLEVYNKEGALGPAARLCGRRSSGISRGIYNVRMSDISDDLESRSSVASVNMAGEVLDVEMNFDE